MENSGTCNSQRKKLQPIFRDKTLLLWHCDFVTSLSLDTLSATERLIGSGMAEAQAKAVIETVQSAELDHVATTQDIQDLRLEIRNLETRVLKFLIPTLLGQVAVFAAAFPDTPLREGLSNLVLAGDWIAAHVPTALMERSALTGRLAANECLVAEGVREVGYSHVTPLGPIL